MSSAEHVLALDLGSSSVRALVLDAGAGLRVRALSRRQVRIELRPDGAATLDPHTYVAAVHHCLDELRDAGSLDGVTRVAVSSQWHSLLVVDGRGDPVTPVFTWAGNQELCAPGITTDEAERLRLATGCELATLYWTLRVPWLRASGAVPRGAVLVSIAGHVLEALLGRRTESASIASGTGLLDLAELAWHPAALDVAGIATGELPELAPSGEALPGGPTLARRYPQLARVPWHVPVGDGAAATVGSGAVPGRDLTITVGTSAAARLLERRDSAGRLQRGCWRYLVDDETVVTGQAWSGGGNLFAWAQEVLRLPADPDELEALLAAVPERAIPIAVPYLYGPRPGNPAELRSGRWTGLSAQVTAAGLLAGLLDGLGFELRLGIANLEEQAGRPASRVLLGGGAVTASRWWQRRLGAQLGSPHMCLVTEPEVTAVGAAAQAAGLAWTPPLESLAAVPELAGRWDRRFEEYLGAREEAIG